MSARSPPRGWAVVHQRGKDDQYCAPDAWRLRDLANHPNDPGWEEGVYDSCKEDVRLKAAEGDIVFDIVCIGDAINGTRVIRSVFVVTRAENRELSFDSFTFLDGEPRDAVEVNFPRNHKAIDSEEVEDYMTQIEATGAYTEYDIGTEPKSVSTEDWEMMVDSADRCDSKSSCGDLGGTC